MQISKMSSFQSQIKGGFIIKLNHLGDQESLSIKIINHTSWQYFEQKVDRSYLRLHKNLSSEFQTPFDIMQYLIANINNLVVSKYGHLCFSMQKSKMTELVIITTEQRMISFQDKVDLKIEQINKKFIQNQKVSLAKHEQNVNNAKKQSQQRIRKVQKRLSVHKIYSSVVLALSVLLSIFLFIGLTNIQRQHNSFKTKIDQISLKIDSFDTQWRNFESQVQDKIEDTHSISQENVQAIAKEILVIRQQLKEIHQKLQQQIQARKTNPSKTAYSQTNEDYGHHPENPHKQHFSIFKSQKSMIVRHTSKSNWYNFINSYQIKVGTKIKYEISIIKITSRNLYIGLGTRQIFGVTLSSSSQAIFYHCGGGLYEGGTYKNTKTSIEVGDVFGVSVDLSENKINWSKNNNLIAESTVPKKLINRSLYLVLYLFHNGDQMEFSLDHDQL